MDRRSGGQGGWVGMIVLLLALVIVAWLAKDALKKYGMIPDAETAAMRAGTPGERSGSAAAGDVERADPTTSAPPPTSAIERARGVENTLKQESGRRGGDY
jgi:hypothetical protein